MTKTKTIPLNHGVKRRLAPLWVKNPNQWQQYHHIKNHLKTFPEFKNLSERTLIRYLNQLVKEGWLEKKIEPTHRTWYKPKSLGEIHKNTLINMIQEINNEHLLNLLFHLHLNLQSKILEGADAQEAFTFALENTLKLLEAQTQIQKALKAAKSDKIQP